MASDCTNVLALPPRLAGITPWRSTHSRSMVTPISRPMISRVAHHGTRPSSDSPTSADPVSALSAIGSIDRAERGDQAAPAGQLAVEPVGERGDREHAERHQPPSGLGPPSSTSSAARNTGTSSSRSPVSMLATLSSGG